MKAGKGGRKRRRRGDQEEGKPLVGGDNDNKEESDDHHVHRQEPGRQYRQHKSYYERLLHACGRDLHKQSKVCKSFECQRLIRRIRKVEQQQHQKNYDNRQPPSSVARSRLDERLAAVKRLPLDRVLRECYRRLGIPLLDPKRSLKIGSGSDGEEVDNGVVDDDNNGNNVQEVGVATITSTASPKGATGDDCEDIMTSARTTQTKEEKDQQQDADGAGAQERGSGRCRDGVDDDDDGMMVERILQHKRMREALEKWNDEVTKYRRWCLRRRDREEERGSDIDDNRKNKKKRKRRERDHLASDVISSAHSLFVQLGGDGKDIDEDGEDRMSQDDNDGGDCRHNGRVGSRGTKSRVKKNRPGPKSRKAKAAAIQARAGRRTPDRSLNHKADAATSRIDHEKAGTSHGDKDRQSRQQPRNGKELHPSWEARKTQRSGIVEFQGTKITF